MKNERITALEAQELKNVNGGVAPGPNGEGCTEHGIFHLLKILNIVI